VAQPDRAARLLLRAIETLRPAERRAVLEALLTGSIGRAGLEWRSPLAPVRTSAFEGPSGRQTEQPLLVRLPVDLHGRFRAWSTQNGFSMAAVARGLIERFLDEQARGQPR